MSSAAVAHEVISSVPCSVLAFIPEGLDRASTRLRHFPGTLQQFKVGGRSELRLLLGVAIRLFGSLLLRFRVLPHRFLLFLGRFLQLFILGFG